MGPGPLLREAADEIERLRGELEEARFDYMQCMTQIESLMRERPALIAWVADPASARSS